MGTLHQIEGRLKLGHLVPDVVYIVVWVHRDVVLKRRRRHEEEEGEGGMRKRKEKEE